MGHWQQVICQMHGDRTNAPLAWRAPRPKRLRHADVIPHIRGGRIQGSSASSARSIVRRRAHRLCNPAAITNGSSTRYSKDKSSGAPSFGGGGSARKKTRSIFRPRFGWREQEHRAHVRRPADISRRSFRYIAAAPWRRSFRGSRWSIRRWPDWPERPRR